MAVKNGLQVNPADLTFHKFMFYHGRRPHTKMTLPIRRIIGAFYNLAVRRGCVYHHTVADHNSYMLNLAAGVIGIENQIRCKLSKDIFSRMNFMKTLRH